ncbi:MAG: hypothetical protein K6F44_08205 [Lachnospiraceae bacterium]|nr:hypothetical protein [Lachnospiraceae bacterium]
MFCENCGRLLEPGEICTCTQQTPVSGEAVDPTPAAVDAVSDAPAADAPAVDAVSDAPAVDAVSDAPADAPAPVTSSGISLVLDDFDDTPVPSFTTAAEDPITDIPVPAAPEQPVPLNEAPSTGKAEPAGNPVIRFLGSPLILIFGLLELAKIVFDIITTINGGSLYCFAGIIPDFVIEGTGKYYNIGLVIVLSILPSFLALAALITFITARISRNSDGPMPSLGLSILSAYFTAMIVIDVTSGVLGAYSFVTSVAASDVEYGFAILLIPCVIYIIDILYYVLLNNSVKGLRFTACNYGRPHRVSVFPPIVMIIVMILEAIGAVLFYFTTYVIHAVTDVLNEFLSTDYLMNDVIGIPKIFRTLNLTSSIEDTVSAVIEKINEFFAVLTKFTESILLNFWISVGLSLLALLFAIIIVFKARKVQKRAFK